MSLAAWRKAFSPLRQRKLMSTFRTLSHSALNRRWTARTSKCSAVRYVEGETAFWTFQYVLRLRTRCNSLSLNQAVNEILKIFLELVQLFNAEILTMIKTIINKMTLNVEFVQI